MEPPPTIYKTLVPVNNEGDEANEPPGQQQQYITVEVPETRRNNTR